MSDISEVLKSMFIITCKACGSEHVRVDFYEGFIHSSGGDTGSLHLECRQCNQELEI